VLTTFIPGLFQALIFVIAAHAYQIQPVQSRQFKQSF